jgi:predicted transcriptional regulator
MINKNINKLVRTDIVKRFNSQLTNTIKYSSSTSSSHPNITNNNKTQWKETKTYRVIKKGKRILNSISPVLNS